MKQDFLRKVLQLNFSNFLQLLSKFSWVNPWKLVTNFMQFFPKFLKIMILSPQLFVCQLWVILWSRGVVVITTAQLYSTKPELRSCAGSNPARSMSEMRDGENLWQWSRLEMRCERLSSVNQSAKTIHLHQFTDETASFTQC